MIRVAVSGAAGRMGRVAAESVHAADGMELEALYAPGHLGEVVAGRSVTDDPSDVEGCDVVVEVTRPDVVMDNLRRWRDLGASVVVGTSGFDSSRVEEVRRMWGERQTRCLVVPNFSVGAVLMMRMAELAAPHFAAAEIVELHHDRKVDVPSGTAISTAERIAAKRGEPVRAVESAESVVGARGAKVAGVDIHSVRLAGLLAHQEVLFGNPGELLTIRHDSTSLEGFVPGLLLAIRSVADLPEPVTVGLEALLGI